MAAVIPMLIGGLGSAGAAGAALIPGIGAAAGAASAATGLATVGSTALSLLQLGGTAMGAISAYKAGEAKKEELMADARRADFSATDEYIAGKAAQADLISELAETVSNQAVAFAAGGVSLSSPSVRVNRQRAEEKAATAIGVTGTNATRRKLDLNAQAARLASAAGNATLSGLLGAGEIVVDGFSKVLARG